MRFHFLPVLTAGRPAHFGTRCSFQAGDMEELASEHPSRQSLPQDQLLDMIQDQGESTLVLKLRGGDVFLDLDELTRASLLTADRIRNLEMEIRRFSNVTNSSGEEGGVKNGTQKVRFHAPTVFRYTAAKPNCGFLFRPSDLQPDHPSPTASHILCPTPPPIRTVLRDWGFPTALTVR